MDKKYIKSILNTNSMIYSVSKNRTQCGHILNDVLFFRIFIESFKDVDINMRIEDNKRIVFYKDNEYYRNTFNRDDLNMRLERYHIEMSNMSFIESVIVLINIFLDLLS